MITEHELLELANKYCNADSEISALISLLKDLRSFQQQIEALDGDFSLTIMAQHFEVEISARLKRALKNS